MRLIYLAGGPGSGKSTLMAALTSRYDRMPCYRDKPPHDVLVDRGTGAAVGAEIGRRRASFGGTDALASTIINTAVPWVESKPYPLILAEGARLACQRFLLAATATYDVTLALLDHPQAEGWRVARSQANNRFQNEAWVRGRISASRNLADKLDGRERITVLRGHPDDLQPILAGLLADEHH